MTWARTTLSVISIAAAAAAQTAPPLKEITDHLRPNDLKADVSFLASDALQGRATPSPGLDVAAEYIAAQFRRAGLDPAGDDGYFQSAQYASVTPVLEGLTVTLDMGGKTVELHKDFALQQAAATDLKGAAVLKVMGGDTAAMAALTPEQVRGKVLALDLPDGSKSFGVLRQLPALTARLQPALVVLLRKSSVPVNAGPRLREVASPPAPAVLVVWDEGMRAALTAGAALTVHIARPFLRR